MSEHTHYYKISNYVSWLLNHRAAPIRHSTPVSYVLLTHIGQLAALLSSVQTLWLATMDRFVTLRAKDSDTPSTTKTASERAESEANALDIPQMLLTSQLRLSSERRHESIQCDIRSRAVPVVKQNLKTF